jgi:hypothetical protein
MAYAKATDVNAHALVMNSDSGIPTLRAIKHCVWIERGAEA